MSKDNKTVKLHAIYHPPGDNPLFTEEITDFLAQNALTNNRDILLGDFKLHWNDPNDKTIQEL